MAMSLKKLADIAGVSDVTVMRALRDEKCVKPELREKIQQLAEKHRYDPNLLAKGLLHGKTHTIGIVLPDVSISHFSACVSSAIKVLKESGYRALILNSDFDPDKEFEEIRHAAMRRVDGLLMIACRESAEAGHFREIQKRKIPLVLMSRAMQSVPFDIFTGADEKDGYNLTQKLLDLGHKRIAHITPLKGSFPNEWLRTNGWQAAMNRAGLKTDNLKIQADNENHEQQIYQKMINLLSGPQAPTAVFIENIGLAAPILKAVFKMNLKPGKDISLATFHTGNLNSTSLSLPPRIGGIIGPSRAIGQQASKRLIELIDSKAQNNEHPKITEIQGTWFDGDTIGTNSVNKY